MCFGLQDKCNITYKPKEGPTSGLYFPLLLWCFVVPRCFLCTCRKGIIQSLVGGVGGAACLSVHAFALADVDVSSFCSMPYLIAGATADLNC